MGAVKKVFKSVGKVFGIGGQESAPSVPNIDTTTTMNVTNSDVSLANDALANPARKRKVDPLSVASDTGDTIVGGAGRSQVGA